MSIVSFLTNMARLHLLTTDQKENNDDLNAELSRTLRVVSKPPHAVVMIAVTVGDVQLSAPLLL